MPELCFYVTGHGFGHAARAQAVVEALLAAGAFSVEVRSAAPRHLFEWLLGDRCRFSHLQLEPGVIQADALDHDLPSTLAAWTLHLAQAPALLEAEADHLRRSGAALVLSDTSPAGCAAGARAGLPALLLGNFTWDWILEGYLDEEPRFAAVVDGIRALQAGASAWLRLPMSVPGSCFAREIPVPLLARQPRRARAEIRTALGISEDERVILIGFGGYGLRDLRLDRVAAHPGVRCLWDRGPSQPPHLLSVTGRDPRYPDLIRAADLVLCKPGYGIFSESIAARTPVAFVPRRGFREAPVLERYLSERWPCLRLLPSALADGSWIEPALRFLDSRPRCPALPSDGARAVVEVIESTLARVW